MTKTPGTGTVNRTQPRKVGHWVNPDVTTGPDALGWTIDSPSGPFNKATFDDTVGAGQAIDCASLVLQLGKGLDAAGHPTRHNALPASKVISKTCTASGLNIVAGPILADQIVRIKYLVNITDPNLASYTNSVNVTVDGTSYGTVNQQIKVQAAGGSGSGTNSPTTIADHLADVDHDEPDDVAHVDHDEPDHVADLDHDEPDDVADLHHDQPDDVARRCPAPRPARRRAPAPRCCRPS